MIIERIKNSPQINRNLCGRWIIIECGPFFWSNVDAHLFILPAFVGFFFAHATHSGHLPLGHGVVPIFPQRLHLRSVIVIFDITPMLLDFQRYRQRVSKLYTRLFFPIVQARLQRLFQTSKTEQSNLICNSPTWFCLLEFAPFALQKRHWYSELLT